MTLVGASGAGSLAVGPALNIGEPRAIVKRSAPSG